jgi:hypothetical protein
MGGCSLHLTQAEHIAILSRAISRLFYFVIKKFGLGGSGKLSNSTFDINSPKELSSMDNGLQTVFSAWLSNRRDET